MGRVPKHPQIERHYTRPPEWRMNPATGAWVIVAPERASRPTPFEVDAPVQPIQEPCPFCAGHEWRTPLELAAFRSSASQPDGSRWRVRVVPNQYAAVKKLSHPEPHGDGFYHRANGVGQHELFIECPQHETNLARLPVEQVREVARMWRNRMLEARRDPHLKYAQLFKNHGPDAGASVEHAHSQMIVTPMIPITIREELAFAGRFFQENDTCVYCELLRREKADGSREVISSAGYSVISAYAARQPFETWIVPKVHHSQFELISDAEADELGTVLWTILRKMDLALEGPSYNLVFHSAPFHEPPLRHFHWHIEVLPRLTQLAGYEWGSGSHVNPILPEDAAVVLREAASGLAE